MYSEKQKKRGSLMFILQADFEYLMAVSVAGVFLAAICKEIGISDSLTGVISSIISFGGIFQLLSVLISKRNIKRKIVIFSILNQLLFTLLYVLPVIKLTKTVKVCIFAVTIVSAYVVYNIIHPHKLNWFMGFVDSDKRGGFTAVKEMISLASGMLLSVGLGTFMDIYREKGETKTAFIICAVGLAVLTVIHTLTILLASGEGESTGNIVVKTTFKDIISSFGDKTILRFALYSALYNISQCIVVPFYGTFQIVDLGFSLQFASIVTICQSGIRILFTRPFGKYADRNGFAKLLRLCLIILAVSTVFAAFSNASNGKVVFMIYALGYGIALAGINSAHTNILFEYLPENKRVAALSAFSAVGGCIGFLTTLVASLLVSYIQNNGNKIFGVPLIAQQFMSLLSFLLLVLTMLYFRFMIMNLKKAE